MGFLNFGMVEELKDFFAITALRCRYRVILHLVGIESHSNQIQIFPDD